MPMTSRERVLSVIHHEQADRVPLVIGVSNATGIKMKPYQGIKRIAGIHAQDNYLYDWAELGTARIDEETMLRLHSDVRGVLDLEPEKVRQRNREREPHSECMDSWGGGHPVGNLAGRCFSENGSQGIGRRCISGHADEPRPPACQPEAFTQRYSCCSSVDRTRGDG